MTHAMPEPHQGGSIFRTIFLPQELNLHSERLGPFRIRYALAEDGCGESQIVLAKLLLNNLSNNSEERSFNAQLAVFWLLQAAKKGLDEAFELLKDCLFSRIGVSAINKSEIEQCLKFSQEEKKARKIAYNITRSIMSDTEEVLSGDIFRENIDLIFKENPEHGDGIWNVPRQKKDDSPTLKKADDNPILKKVDDSQPLKKPDAHRKKADESLSLKKSDASPFLMGTDDSPPQKKRNASPQKRKADDSPSQSKAEEIPHQPVIQADETSHVSFNKVVSSVQSCLEGNVPLVSLAAIPQFDEHRRWLPIKFLRTIKDLILRCAEKSVQSISSLVIVLSVLFLCMLLQFFDYFVAPGNERSNFIRKLNVYAVTLLSLLTMISCTCYVLQVNFGSDNFKKWLSLIKIFDSNVRSVEVERKYISKTVFPHVTFFIISFMYMALVPLIITPLTLPDIGIISFVFMILIDRSIYQQRYYVNISLVLNALTCLYTINIQNIFTTSLSYFNYTINYEISNNFHLHISVLSCLTLPFILPFLYFKMARSQPRGWHLVLLPHLMSLTWMNVACIHLADTSTTCQLYSLITLFVTLLVSKYLGMSFTLVLYLLFKGADYFGIEVVLLCLVFIILYFACLFFVVKFKVSHDSKFWSVFICLSIMMLSYQVTKSQDSLQDDSKGFLPWLKYQTYCYNQAWSRSNTAEFQISCLPFKGSKVSVEGSITDIDIIEINNKMELIANVLPQPLQNWFVCGFGKSYTGCDSEDMTSLERERCELYGALNLNQCHLRNWDEYHYRILLEVNTRSSAEISLHAYHGGSELFKNLKEGDSLQVIGTLESKMGTHSPEFSLNYAKCTSCYTDFVYQVAYDPPKLNHGLSLKNLVQLYFAPILLYGVK